MCYVQNTTNIQKWNENAIQFDGIKSVVKKNCAIKKTFNAFDFAKVGGKRIQPNCQINTELCMTWQIHSWIT